MKKKILNLLLISIIVLCLIGCGKKEDSHSLGEKVSNELVELTIENAKLTIAIDSEGNAKDYEEGKKYEYVASKGHVYASLTLIIKNLDRSRLDINKDFITVKYNGKESNKLQIISLSEDLAEWGVTSKISLDAGKELTYKTYIEIDSDAKDLEDDFEVSVDLPKSDGSKETYNFLITKSDRENVKIREISLETAINKYPSSATLEYFEKHKDEFETLNETEITEFIKSNNGNHYLNFEHKDYKRHEFTEMKPSGNNLIIWPGGTGASSFMYDVGKWNIENNILKINSREYIVKKLTEKNYLLINKSNNSVEGLMK